MHKWCGKRLFLPRSARETSRASESGAACHKDGAFFNQSKSRSRGNIRDRKKRSSQAWCARDEAIFRHYLMQPLLPPTYALWVRTYTHVCSTINTCDSAHFQYSVERALVFNIEEKHGETFQGPRIGSSSAQEPSCR